MKWISLLLLLPLVSAEFVELCCTFTDSTAREVKTLSTMFESVGHKVIMGCSKKPEKQCACFENTWSCPTLTVTRLAKGERFEVANGQTAAVFHNIMKEMNPTIKQDKDSRSIFFCEDSLGTPFLWSLVTQKQYGWGNKKFCFSPGNKFEVKLDAQTSIGFEMMDAPSKSVLEFYGRDREEVPSFDTVEDTVVINVETTSEVSFESLSSAVARSFPMIELVQSDITKDANIRREELVMEFETVRCRSFNYISCLSVYQHYLHGRETHPVFHLSEDLLDLFLTTAISPIALIIHSPGHFEEAQEVLLHLDASLSQSTLGNYTLALMEATAKHSPGIYYSLRPNNLLACKEELYRCLSNQLDVYLPPVTRPPRSSFSRVYGEQHLNQENEHRGNLNNPWYFEPPLELLQLSDIREKLQQANRNPILSSPTTSLTVLSEIAYRRVLKGETGTFVIFVFRSDVGSLYTLQEILATNLTGLNVVECFNLNLICQKLAITTYPAVKYIRKGEVLPYTGAIEEGPMRVFRELVTHPVVTISHRIQIDLVMKDPDYKAVVMLSGGGRKKREELFHLACDELYGAVRCYLLQTPSSNGAPEDMVIVHVPNDPVMINKKFALSDATADKALSSVEGLVARIRKLALPSVISERDLLVAYRELTEIVLFEATVDDVLARTISHFPHVQFVQISSAEFKHDILQQLIGYDYENAVLYISKTRNVGFQFREGATLETWLTGITDGSLSPDFQLRDLEGSKFQYHDIFYKSQFRNFESSVRAMREKIDQLNQNLGKSSEWVASHQEL